MGDDVTVLRDETAAYDDGTVASVRVLAVPQSETYPAGINTPGHNSVNTTVACSAGRNRLLAEWTTSTLN